MKCGLKSVAFVALSLELGLLHGAGTTDLSQIQKNLRQIQQKKIQVQKDLKGQQKTERHILRDLSTANQKLNLARRDLKTYQHNLSVVRNRLADLNRKEARYQADIALERGMLKKELVALYKSGPLGGVKLLLSSRNPYELISRYHTLRTFARYNSARISQIRTNMIALQEAKAENLRQEFLYKTSKKGAERSSLNAGMEKKRRENLLGSVRLKKTRSQTLMKELATAALQLQNLFSRLQGEAEVEQRRRHQRVGVELDQGPSRLGRRHSLPWPVRGRVLSRFGQQQHPFFNTPIFNRGIEIAAPLGTAVKAVAAGIVRYADNFEGYGQMVILDHGGSYFTVYGHNSGLSVKEGERVAQGQPIAEVGDSSTLRRAALYFEVRSLAKAVDPFIWLAR